MSSMKTLIVLCVLSVAGYWMYMNLWQKPETAPANAQAYLDPPSVQIPGLPSPASQLTGTPSASSAFSAPTLLGSGSTPAVSSNTNQMPGPFGSTAIDPAANPAPTADGSGVTLLSPPGQNSGQNNPSTSQNIATSPGTPQNLLRGSTAATTPTAAYPSPYNSPSASTESSTESIPDADFQNTFAELMRAIQKKLDEGRLAEAHSALSALYSNPNLPKAQAQQIVELLDQLAGTVIYSRQHILEQPYIVQPGDTLGQIADRYNVPELLLARINGVRDPQQLEPGRELKVVRGPFNAVINLDKHELALMVDNCYAGRFSIGVGRDQPKLEGEYTVREKNVNPEYRGGGVNVPGGDPRNPLGKYWIGLSDNIGLHGTVDPTNIGRDDNRGTICLGDRDIDDLYGILSVGSKVKIVR
jgi:LysM repeat protein